MRAIWPISISPTNPDAQVVAQALKDAPKGERSALILRWAAAYLQGRAKEQPIAMNELGMSDAELSELLDDF
jgi:hypothetical protein